MLVVAWKLSAENMGFFKLSEWKSGMCYLGYVLCSNSFSKS